MYFAVQTHVFQGSMMCAFSRQANAKKIPERGKPYKIQFQIGKSLLFPGGEWVEKSQDQETNSDGDISSPNTNSGIEDSPPRETWILKGYQLPL